MASTLPGRGASTTSTYIDLDSLTSDTFSPYTHANNLVLATNNPSDPSIDLTTPLSRVLFDLQEIDSHIHTLTSRSALEILTYTSRQNQAAQRILARVEEERVRLNASYERLEKEVLVRHQKAVEAKATALRSWDVLRLGRSVQRILNLARQFEVVIAESGLGGSRVGKEDHIALVQSCLSILAFRDALNTDEDGQSSRINLVRALRGRVFEDGEARILDYARRVVREFSMSTLASTASGGGVATTSTPTFREAEDSRARFTSASHILYLLSPAPRIEGKAMRRKDFESEYLIRALQGYLQTAITSSSASIGRALGQLPNLDRALLETSARCQNIVALEALLRSITAPEHPLLESEVPGDLKTLTINDEDSDEDEVTQPTKQNTENFLTLLLHALDTASLPSYFWRSLASSLSARVQDILNRGGVSARTLRSQRDAVRAEIRECVLRGSRLPRTAMLIDARAGTAAQGEEVVENWEREAAVMVGSVVGPLGR